MQGIHATTHSGKLEGIPSINTSPLDNEFCAQMSAFPWTVCHHCYARRLVAFRKAMRKPFVTNFDLLNSGDFPMPVFNERYVRFHSFGELGSVQHLLSFYRIAEANPETTFALWTKRRDLVERVSLIYRKPANLILIYSIPTLDPIDAELEVPTFFDKVYAVYGKAPPCGDKCLSCLRCYRKDSDRVIKQGLH